MLPPPLRSLIRLIGGSIYFLLLLPVTPMYLSNDNEGRL